MRKHALITGASGEIGAAISRELSAGYDLTIVGGKNVSALESLRSDLSETVPGCFIQTASGDVKDSSFVRETVRLAVSHAPVDAFVHCAGVSYTGLLQDMSDEGWDNVMSTNLSSGFYFAKELIPDMLKNPGRMLFISSIWGNMGASCEVAYSASKAGVEGFVRALAKELAPSGIPVNALAPGFIDTKMNAHLSPDEREAFIDSLPIGRAGTAEEVAKAAARILDMPVYMTGQIVRLDGGM